MLLSVGCNNIKAEEISSSDGIAACESVGYFYESYSSIYNSSYSKEDACVYLQNNQDNAIEAVRGTSKDQGFLCYLYLYQLCHT